MPVIDDGGIHSQHNHTSKKKDAACIKDVWATTLVDEMHKVSEMIEQFPYVSMVCDPA